MTNELEPGGHARSCKSAADNGAVKESCRAVSALSETELGLIRGTALLGQVGDDLLDKLLSVGRVQEADTGEVLFLQGDRTDAFFIVLAGWVKLYRLTESGGEAVVSVFTRGQSFAEAAVFSMPFYPVTAEVVAPSRLLRLPSSGIHSSVRDDPEFAMSMLASTSRHLHELVRQIEQLKTQTGEQRVARFLAGLCPVDAGSYRIGLPYDKALIAGRLGMKPESLSRAFSRLKRIGVRIDRNAAEVANVERLKQFSGEDRGSGDCARP